MMRPNGIFVSLLLAATTFAQDPVKPPLPPRPPGPTGPAGAAPFQPARLEKPADPAKVRATYELEGATVQITEGAYFDALSMLQKMEGRSGSPVTDGRVYEHMLAYAEASALGLAVTDEEFAATDPMKRNPALAEQLRKRWEQEGITEDLYARYQKETATVQRAKDLFANSMRVKSTDVFDGYAKDHYTYKLEYVVFPASDHTTVLTNASDDDLRKFWDDDRTVQNMMRVPMSISAEFIWLDPTAPGSNVAEGTRKPSYDETLAYYNRNKDRLNALIPPQRRPELYPTDKADPSKLVTPFSILRETIEKEMMMSGAVREALVDAGAPGSDMKAVAAKRGLQYHRVDRVDRPGFATAGGNRYGVQAFSALFNLNPGMLLPDVSVEGRVQWIARLVEKDQARLPEFAEVKGKLGPIYVENTSMKMATQRANDVRKALDEEVARAAKPEIDALLAAADAEADREAKERNITEPKEVEVIRTRARTLRNAAIADIQRKHMSKSFDAVVAAKGLKLETSEPFGFEPPRTEREVSNTPKSRQDFIKSAYQVRDLREPGQVTAPMVDPQGKTIYIARLVERLEPNYADMTDSELVYFRTIAERTAHYQSNYRWYYYEISKRRNLVIAGAQGK